MTSALTNKHYSENFKAAEIQGDKQKPGKSYKEINGERTGFRYS